MNTSYFSAACLPGIQTKESMPLPVKQSVLNSMSISAEWKHQIFIRAEAGPLAQRVSQTTVRSIITNNPWMEVP